jgi:Tfp pilus assembly protein PilF
MRFALICVAILIAAGCDSPEDAPYQSDRRPLDLPIYDTVKAAGSDRQSARFDSEQLRSLIEAASESFRRERIDRDFKDLALDPAKLRIVERTPVRVYFVGEASGASNALGINLTGVGLEGGDPRLLFPNVTSAIDLYQSTKQFDTPDGTLNRDAFGDRRKDAPLQPGDFIDLGTMDAGTELEFFLLSNANDPAFLTYTPHPERNHDGFQHMVAIVFNEAPLLLLSFEDLTNLGDKDFSDCVFAIELSEYNVQALLGRIDPWRRAKQIGLVAGIAALVFGGPAGFAAARRIQQRRRAARAHGDASKLAQNNPEQALSRLDEALHTPLDKESTRKLTALKRDILVQAADGSSLTAVAEDAPDVVGESEPSSLLAGRAFLAAASVEGYEALRDRWREGSAFDRRWRELDAEALLVSGRDQDVVAMLSPEDFTQPEDAGLLARYALARAAQSPEEAVALAERAVRLSPQHAEARLALARIYESAGRIEEAEHSYSRALQFAPRDPAVRLEAGAYFRRLGAYDKAIAVWSAGLRRPSNADLWLQTLFWRKVAHPVAVDFKSAVPPEGELRPLIEFVLSLPDTAFWDEARFDRIVQARPGLAARQEVYWLKLLECLRRGDEAGALYLLNVQRFGSASWRADLETALVLIASYRTSGFMDPGLLGDGDGDSTRVALFAQLNRWARGECSEVPGELRAVVEGAGVYGAVLKAAGWHAAAGLFGG